MFLARIDTDESKIRTKIFLTSPKVLIGWLLWISGIAGLLFGFGLVTNILNFNQNLNWTSVGPVRDRMFMVSDITLTDSKGKAVADAIVTLDSKQQVVSNQIGVASFDQVMHDNHLLTVLYNEKHYQVPFHLHGSDINLVLGMSEEERQQDLFLISLALGLWLGLGFGFLEPFNKIKLAHLKGLSLYLTKKRRPFAALTVSMLFVVLFSPIIGQESQVKAATAANVSAPDKLHIEEDDNNAILSWGSGSTAEKNPEGVAGYKVSWGLEGQPLGNSSLTQYRIIQLQPLINGKKYTVHVQAVDFSGNLSAPSQSLTFTGNPERVQTLRNQMTGFFDDFDRPVGAPDELKWNTAYSACNDPNSSAMFINAQFHVHNMLSATNCDRGQSISRPRSVFDFGGRTGTITFDFDGEFRRDQWYLDLVPQLLDITGQIHIEAGDAPAAPTNMLRIHQDAQQVQIIYIDNNGMENIVATNDGNPYPPLDEIGLQLVSNVRRHWEIKVSQNSVEIIINGKSVLKSDKLNLPFTKGYLLWNEFSYNTPKSNEPSALVHWDNFGFDGPHEPIVTHNYRTAGYGGYDFVELGQNSISREVKIPDSLAGVSSERLFFTMQMSKQWYKWSADDKVIVNGQSFPIPQPKDISGDVSNLVSTINPYSMVIKLPANLLKTSINQIQFSMYSCGITNVHLEADFPEANAPAYTQPDKVYDIKTVPTMPDVGPGTYIQELGVNNAGGTNIVSGDEVKQKVFPVQGVVPVHIVAHNDIAMAATGQNPGITKIVLRLNQQPVYTQELGIVPYFETTYNLDTAKYTNGSYFLDVIAYNSYGTVSTPDYFQSTTSSGQYFPVQVKIDNAVSGQNTLPAVAPEYNKAELKSGANTNGTGQAKPVTEFDSAGNPIADTTSANQTTNTNIANPKTGTGLRSLLTKKNLILVAAGFLLGLFLIGSLLFAVSINRKRKSRSSKI